MLTVEDYEIIRLKSRDEGLSQRQIARTLGYSRKTVAKALKNAIPPGYCLSVARPKTVISSFTHIIDYFLEENKKITRRKQRMNAKKIYELLCDVYGYTGHYCTVSRYIKSVNIYKKEVFMPLSFEPGQEAQVDWHEAIVYCNGVQKKQYVFCMKLCFSKAPFTISYDSMRIECFLDGHVKAFEYFGGVPKQIAYDNLKTAVKKILFNGDRILNRRFIELRSWYLFKTRFCNVAKGNEKGNVENLAKRSQSYFFSPIPEVSSTQELNIKLLSDCKKELLRKGSAPNTDKTIGELLEIERQNLNSLAEQPFQTCRDLLPKN
jgi:transposase